MHESPLTPGRLMLLGLQAAVVSAVATAIVQSVFFATWLSLQGINPDFGGNGFNWVVVGLAVVLPFVHTLVLLVLFGLYLPLRFKALRDHSAMFDRQKVSLVCALIAGGAELLLLFGRRFAITSIILISPLPLATYFSVRALTRRANLNLSMNIAMATENSDQGPSLG